MISARIATATLLTLTAALLTTPATAQTSGSDRLFLGFAEEAAVVDSQWWEGQGQLLENDNFDALIAVGVAAFQVADGWEVGGKVGFGNTDASDGLDGTGATDLDAWGKYYFGAQNNSEFAALKMVVVAPTPIPTVRLATSTNMGCRRSNRSAKRTS